MKLVLKIAISCFYLLITNLCVWGQENEISIDESFLQLDISSRLNWVPSTEKVQTLSQFLEFIKSNPTIHNPKSNIHFPLGENSVWYYGTIINRSQKEIKLVAEIQNFWILDIEGFVSDHESDFLNFQIGLQSGYKGKIIPYKYAAFPINLEAGESKLVMIRGRGQHMNGSHSLRLLERKFFERKVKKMRAYTYALFGGLLMFLILAIAMYVVTKERLFGLYTLYVAAVTWFTTVLIKFGYEYIYPEWGKFTSIEIMLASIASSSLFLLLIIKYYEKEHFTNPFLKYRKWIIGLAVLLFIGKLLHPLIYFKYGGNPVIIPISFISLVFLTPAIIIVSKAVKKLKSLDAVLYLIVIVMYFLISALSLAINQKLIPLSLDIPSLILTNLFVEIIFLTIIFSRKIYLRNQERNQLYFKVQELKLEEERAKKLEDLDKLKNQFLANISHEFRTPLTLIKGNLERIEGYPKIKDQIREQGNKILGLINQLLQLSHLQSGKLEINKEQRDIMQLVRYLVHSYESWSESKEIQLVQECSLSSFYMDMNYDFTEKIISNLLSNAIKYTPPGGKVSLKCENYEKQFLITIEDNGIGIPESELPRISERFFRASNAEKIEAKGMGIGLAMVKGMIEQLGGKLLIESEEKKGSKFTVIFPVTNRSSIVIRDNGYKEDREVSQHAGIKQNEISETEISSEELPLLLIIEDNEDITNYIRFVVLEKFRVISAVNGNEGVELALQEVPDIILTDIMMPELDGFGVLSKLKSNKITSHVPIVFLTAKVDNKDKLKALQGEADAYLTKPFEKEELLLVLENLLKYKERLQLYFSNGTLTSIHHKTKMTSEVRFLDQMNSIIEENLEDFQFDVVTLASSLAMSRSQLYRKTKAITNRSIVDYVRFYRLQKAQDLLVNSDLNVSEISGLVGFNDPAYFSRCFRNEFNSSPQEYKEEVKQTKR